MASSNLNPTGYSSAAVLGSDPMSFWDPPPPHSKGKLNFCSDGGPSDWQTCVCPAVLGASMQDSVTRHRSSELKC